MTNQGVGALPLHALRTTDLLNKLSISLTVIHHIEFTHHYGGQGGSNLGVFLSLCTFKMIHVQFLDN